MAEGRITSSEANDRAGTRLIAANGSVITAFGDLGLGWSAGDVMQYLQGTPGWRALARDGTDGKAFGLMLAIAVVCVEQDRIQRGD